MLVAAGLGVGIIAGALVSPPTPVEAQGTLIAVRTPGRAAALATNPLAAASLQAPGPPEPGDDSSASGGDALPATTATAASSTTTASSGSGSGSGSGSASSAPGITLPPIKHVWLIVLDDQTFASLFGFSSAAQYLNNTLVNRGTLLTNYYATAHGALADGIALLSGQGPTTAQQADCPTFARLRPATVVAKSGQVRGRGCVFPATVPTLPGQLTAAKLTWRAYVAGQRGRGCRHPALGATDASAAADPGDGYLTWRNPFVYFAALTASRSCAHEDVGLGQLGADLHAGHIANLSWIAPDPCTAGDGAACAPAGTTTASATAADAFLKEWVPKIEATRAYRKGGMIVIFSDQAPASGPDADSSGCCGRLRYLNTTNPGGPSTPGKGGGRVGALILSPFAAKGVVDITAVDHFTLLRTIEDIFKLPPLGYAKHRQPFDQTVFPSETGGS